MTDASVTTVEQHGVESIPDQDRDSTIFDFMRLCWGGANSLATAVLGAFPIMFGLSFWQATAAAVLGVVLGSLILAPMSIFGPINGTNNAVSSSAHFGVVGRIVGSFLSLLTAIAFFAISVWSSGDAVVGAARLVFHIRGSDFQVALVYAVFALSVLIVCIYGFRMMLLVNKIAVVASTALFVLGLAAFWTLFDPGYAGSGLRWGAHGFWPIFISSALIVLSNPISFGAFLGDWTRYLPRSTSKPKLHHGHDRCPMADLAAVSIWSDHRFGRCQARPGLSRTGRLHGRPVDGSPGLFSGAFALARGAEWHVHGYYVSVWNGARLLQCISPSQPAAGYSADRYAGLCAYLCRPVLFQSVWINFDLRIADHRNHYAMDGHYDDWVRGAPGILYSGRHANFQSRANRRTVLVHGRMECGRYIRLDRFFSDCAAGGEYPDHFVVGWAIWPGASMYPCWLRWYCLRCSIQCVSRYFLSREPSTVPKARGS